MLMLILSWMTWWYGRGWSDLVGSLRTRLTRIYLEFSVPLLVRTLFAPWRRITSSKGGPLGDRIRATVDNAVSRTVGLVVRCLTLITAVLVLAVGSLISLLLVAIWPLVLPAAVLFIVLGTRS